MPVTYMYIYLQSLYGMKFGGATVQVVTYIEAVFKISHLESLAKCFVYS